MAKVKQVLTLLVGTTLILILNNKIGDVPPLGKLLNPYTGFWQNAESKSHFSNESIRLKGATDEIEIIWDQHLIPHIYAKNEADLFLAQGYVTAKLRLWQMEFQTHFAAGRLCEIVGKKALQIDEFQRRIGMGWASKKSWEYVKQNGPTQVAIESYTNGINEYINTLDQGSYPLEYKILDYEPEDWTPYKTANFLKLMSWDLTGDRDDFAMSELLNRWGYNKMEDIFSSLVSDREPIIPAGTKFDSTALLTRPSNFKNPVLPFENNDFQNKPHPDNGSNNWVVSGKKTKSGRPILSNDPHLNQRLPSIWMLVHLNAPGIDVFGVSMPGSPGVIIGFNRNIAWGQTNVDPDIMDWYRIKFKDETRKEYFHDGEWKSTFFLEEVIKIRGEKDKVIQIPFTHHGPVSYLGNDSEAKPSLGNIKGIAPTGFSMKWAAHKESNELLTFLLLNKGENYGDYVSALSHFGCPAQNFAFASRDGDIALWVNGEFPQKWEDQGKYLLDGEDPSHEWGKRIPHSQNPHVKNPNRGFISSANQHSTDTTYPYYMNWEFDPYMRGRRINNRLQEMNEIEPNDMMKLQLDNKNLLAERVLESMLGNMVLEKLNPIESDAIEELKRWNRFNDPDEIGPGIFVFWWEYFERELWADELSASRGAVFPPVTETIDQILDSAESVWFDNIKSDDIETRSFILNKSFRAAMKELEKRFGENVQDWNWQKVNNPSVPHLAEIPGMGVYGLNIGGGKHIINQQQHKHGPSWRFVVEMKDDPEAYGAIPGGQSGNPGSFYYSNLIDNWAVGNLVPLSLRDQETQREEEKIAVWNLSPEK